MAILCHSLINIKVENLSAFSYLRKRFFFISLQSFSPRKNGGGKFTHYIYILIKNSKQYGQNNH